MPDLYIYNGSNKFADVTPTIDDLANGRSIVVPPGQQAHVTVPDAPTYNAIVALLGNYGTVDHSTGQKPGSFSGISKSTVPIANVGKPVPIIVVPARKSQIPTKGK